MGIMILFLRGINVSGQRKIKMADLRHALIKGGFKDVQTYIQSGNIILTSEHEAVGQSVGQIIKKSFDFEVPVLSLTVAEIKHILNNIPFQQFDEKNLYFTLLFENPGQDLVEAFNKMEFQNEDFVVTSNCVYLNCKKGAGKAKLNNNLIEKKLQIIATTRNLNTMRKMLEMAS